MLSSSSLSMYILKVSMLFYLEKLLVISIMNDIIRLAPTGVPLTAGVTWRVATKAA
jgi:hypothetical protein